MNYRPSSQALWPVLDAAPVLLFALVLLVFGLQSPQFLQWHNFINILVQSSSTAVVAIGMTFVLLTAGVDLSVGAIMFVGAAVAGKMLQAGAPLPAAALVMLGLGLVYGTLNAVLITRLKVVAFIATLATLYFGRGLGLWITETRAINLPESFLQLGATQVVYIPVPILIFAAVLLLAHLTLAHTPFGRHIYAVGQNAEFARKAGIRVRGTIAAVYIISGFCAALGGVLSLTQLGSVSPTFGNQKEFAAIAAAVLGGTSLFGGRGKVFPGTVLGALLIQSVENGLVIMNANPYLYPLITSAIIFVAVLTDSLRNRWLDKLRRRKIRVEEAS